ncbi:LOW QUALITY PROTEIN: hypothetical protein BC936DRAFT_149579 [Jimgerdemannia flammicorona]|uniref:Uncharacterized protein n=1 Tax=Jimgerdemannia flammicorona TaxID=994334 RepID=A0A433DK50_9FUNG|nr:LOW QUALITY PROTEIN: hypothetical protein BC936DRAFT_149579 [Jimgerdemannia flammicorona]
MPNFRERHVTTFIGRSLFPLYPEQFRFEGHFNKSIDFEWYRKGNVSLYQRELTIRKKIFGTEHQDTESALSNLAELYFSQGKYDEAEPLYERWLAIEEVLGPEHQRVTDAKKLSASVAVLDCEEQSTGTCDIIFETFWCCSNILCFSVSDEYFYFDSSCFLDL